MFTATVRGKAVKFLMDKGADVSTVTQSMIPLLNKTNKQIAYTEGKWPDLFLFFFFFCKPQHNTPGSDSKSLFFDYPF